MSRISELKEKLHANGELVIKSNGDSMLGAIGPGEELKIAPLTNVLSLQRFDIVVFQRDDKLICHYFWKINQLLTDNGEKIVLTRPTNPVDGFDHPIKSCDVIGKVINHKLGLSLKLKIVWNSLLKNFRS